VGRSRVITPEVALAAIAACAAELAARRLAAAVSSRDGTDDPPAGPNLREPDEGVVARRLK